jgi:hypothetical protein
MNSSITTSLGVGECMCNWFGIAGFFFILWIITLLILIIKEKNYRTH